MFLIKGKKGAEEMLIIMIMLFVLTLMFLGIFYYLWNYDVDDGNSFLIPEKVILLRVLTGDTILLNNGDYVKLLCIKAPSEDMKLFKESRDYLNKLLNNKTIILERDVDNRDESGRLLRYVYVDDSLINAELIKTGLVIVYPVTPNTKNCQKFFEYELNAKQQKINIWGLPREERPHIPIGTVIV